MGGAFAHPDDEPGRPRDKIAASAYCDLPDTPIDVDGTRTAVALAVLELDDDEAFDRIEAAMRKLVPSLERVRIKPAEVVRRSRGDTVVGRDAPR